MKQRGLAQISHTSVGRIFKRYYLATRTYHTLAKCDGTFRLLLQHAPDPYLVRALGIQGIIKLFHDHQTSCGPKIAQRILACANQALPPPGPLVAVYRQGLEQLRQDEQHWLERHDSLLAQLASFVQNTPAQFLLSINGISPTLAAHYLSLVGAPPFFDWPDQVWAYVGFDPIQSQSGDSNPNLSSDN